MYILTHRIDFLSLQSPCSPPHVQSTLKTQKCGIWPKKYYFPEVVHIRMEYKYMRTLYIHIVLYFSSFQGLGEDDSSRGCILRCILLTRTPRTINLHSDWVAVQLLFLSPYHHVISPPHSRSMQIVLYFHKKGMIHLSYYLWLYFGLF